MKNKKILEISSYPPPRTGWGVRIEYVKKKLIAMGHDCKVLNIGQSRKIKSKDYISVQNSLDYVWKVFKYCVLGYVVHMHVNGKSHNGLILTMVSEIISLLLGKRCFLTFHAGVKQTYFPKENKPWFYIPIFSIIFSLPRLIICNDEEVKRKIMEYGINGNKIIPIPAFSKQYMEYNEVGLSKEVEFFFKNHKHVLSSYVLLRPTFCIDASIRAIHSLREEWPDIGLVFIGSNVKEEDMDATEITELIKDLKLEENVFWTGDLDHDEFLTVLESSHIFVRSPTDDGICSSVLEALYLKVPVVATKNDLRPEGVITFKAGDVYELTEKIRYVLDNYEAVKANLPRPEIRDTVLKEAELLVS